MDGASDGLEKLEEMLKSMDGDSPPSQKDILEMLEQSEMDEELKENLKSMLSGSTPQLFAGYGGGTYLGIAFVVLIFAVLCISPSSGKVKRAVENINTRPSSSVSRVPISRNINRTKKMAGQQSAGIGAQIGRAVTQKITDGIRNADVITLLKNIAAMAEEDGESDDVKDKLLGVLKEYEEMGENEKISFANQLKETLASKLESKFQEMPLNLPELDQAITRAIVYKLAIYAVGALILIALFVFFGYKLYKSIKDKEKKREEKKKAKQMKKKK